MHSLVWTGTYTVQRVCTVADGPERTTRWNANYNKRHSLKCFARVESRTETTCALGFANVKFSRLQGTVDSELLSSETPL